MALMHLSLIVSVNFPLLESLIPKYLYVSTRLALVCHSRTLRPQPYGTDLDSLSYIYFSPWFIVRPHLLQYCPRLFMHCCKPCIVSETRTKSSAQERELILWPFKYNGMQASLKILCRSFWNMLDKVGLRLHPCLTPFPEGKYGVKPWEVLTQYSELV